MLSSFDWIRRSRSGAELLATLKCLAAEPDLVNHEEKIGPPYSAINSPCQRCWVYPRLPGSIQEDDVYCRICEAIVVKTRGLGTVSRQSVVVWCFVNFLPKQIQNKEWPNDNRILGAYVHDSSRFLLMMHRRDLKDWLQELVLYSGTDLRGLIQILPTIGSSQDFGMGEVLCRAVHHEANYPMDRLRVRFYTTSYQILVPHKLDRKGILTFEVSEFLNLMGMVMVFRVFLRPEEQKALYELLNMDKTAEEQFYWGRFQGSLSQEARDMLNAWKIRQWSKDQIRLLYKLIDYVELYQFH